MECKGCGCEIPEIAGNRQPRGMEPEYCEWCDPDAPDRRDE